MYAFMHVSVSVRVCASLFFAVRQNICVFDSGGSGLERVQNMLLHAKDNTFFGS